MAFTLRDVIDEAAKRLGELATGQTLSAEQLAVYQTNLEYLLDQLDGDNVCTIADHEDVPPALVPYLATLLANLVGPSVGIPFSLQVKQATEAIIRKITRTLPSYEPQRPDYF